MFSFPSTVFLYFAIFWAWLQQLLWIIRWFAHLYSLGSTISTFSYIPAVPCFPEWSLSYVMSAFEELPTYSSFCRLYLFKKDQQQSAHPEMLDRILHMVQKPGASAVVYQWGLSVAESYPNPGIADVGDKTPFSRLKAWGCKFPPGTGMELQASVWAIM